MLIGSGTSLGAVESLKGLGDGLAARLGVLAGVSEVRRAAHGRRMPHDPSGPEMR